MNVVGGGGGRVEWRENGFQSEKQNNMYSLTFCAHALDPLKTARGVAETRLTVKKKCQRTITLVKIGPA